MATITPNFTDNVSVIAAASLSRGSISRATIDLRTKRGAYIFLGIGRQGTTALTNGVKVLIRRTLNNDSSCHPASVVELLSQITAASSTTVNSDSNSGQAAINVASITGFAADDLVTIEGASQARLEFRRISKTATGILTADRNLENSHTAAQADNVRNKADAWVVWVDGGATYEVIFDYGDDAAGESVTIVSKAQTYDSDTSA